MARTILDGKIALILGVETAPGRACAQQLSRAGCKVLLSGLDSRKADELGSQLARKGGYPHDAVLPRTRDAWKEFLIAARSQMGHIHLVVNAMALAYDGRVEGAAAEAHDVADLLDSLCLNVIAGRGPFRMATLWPAGTPLAAHNHPHWHCHVTLGPFQRLDEEAIDALDAGGVPHLRAGGVGDSMVALFQVPPSVRPATIHLESIPSSEKKK
jgi:NAD(P)-dependent dehydrogenase (short-subunit alcohol dehydrogenase family)